MKVLPNQDVKPPVGGRSATTRSSMEQNELEITQTTREIPDTVVLVCKNGHSIVWPRQKLGNVGKYFNILLYGNFRERALEVIKLEDVDGDLLKALLNFYDRQSKEPRYDEPQFSRVFIKDFESAWELVQIADMFGLSEALNECDKYLLQTFHLYDSFEVCRLAQQFSRFSLLKEVVRTWSVENKKSDFEHNHKHCVENSCLCAYAKHYKESQTIYIIGGYFYENYRDCDRTEWEKFLSSKNVSPSADSDNCVTKPSIFENKQCYPGSHNEECRVAALNTDIYVTGGFDSKAKALSQVWKYDTRKDTWERTADMRNARFYHCIAISGNHIYVCGGYDDNFVLDSLERYHPHYNEWVNLAKMPLGVGNAAYASDGNALYVTCGQYGYKEIQTTNNVQYYNIASDQWSLLTSYQSPVFYPNSEYGLSSATLNGNLIILGGQTERCDSFNIEEKKWRRLSNMNNRRMETSVITYQGKIYAAGGYDYRTGHYHDTVEEYDIDLDKWTVIQHKLPRPARSFGLCHIFDVEPI